MSLAQREAGGGGANLNALLAYVADLELEVDRLRKQGQFVRQQTNDALRRILQACGGPAVSAAAVPAAAGAVAADTETGGPLAEIAAAARELAVVLRDAQELPGYHPAHDQVVAIAVRPLAEQVFRWQQRLAGAARVVLRLELEVDHVEWFPARLRHILDNLFSNALKYHDTAKEESWVCLGLRASPRAYELRVTDNGVGLPAEARAGVLELIYRAAPVRAAGLGVGLAVVKLLVEQSGGSLTVDSGEGQGSTFVAVLPRYDIDDYLI